MRPRKSSFLAFLKRLMPLHRQVAIAAAVLPSGVLFRFALAISRWQGRLVGRFGGNAALTEVVMRDHWLRDLTLHRAFRVPMRLHGRDVLDRFAVPGPVLYFTTHLPLGEVPLRVAMELGYPVPVPVADPGRIVGDEQYVVPGMAERISAIPVSGHVLARMRTLLVRGTSIVCLAESEFGGEFSPNPLRLAARLRIPVLFVWAELAPDRVVDVTFQPAPHPYSQNEQEIAENLAALRVINDRILHSLGVLPAAPGRSIADPEASPAALDEDNAGRSLP